jgi:hypothetical protein
MVGKWLNEQLLDLILELKNQKYAKQLHWS